MLWQKLKALIGIQPAVDPKFHDALYGQPRRYYDPRRFQLMARFQF